MTDPAPTFDAYSTPTLRDAGLEGTLVHATIDAGDLVLRGEGGGIVRIMPEEIERMRVGYTDTKGRLYETVLWRRGRGERIALAPTIQSWGAYAVVLRRFVQSLADRGRLGVVERGRSKGEAASLPIVFGLLSVIAITIAVVVLEHEPWWGRLIVPIVPVSLFAFTLHVARTRAWPRPIRQLSELDAQLPR